MFDKRNLNSYNPGASVVVPVDEKTGRFALVIDRSKPEPHYWKFPGGKIDPEDRDPKNPNDDYAAADNAARRETEEETGLKVRVLRLGKLEKKTHTQYFYVGLADFSELAATGDEGEIVKVFSLDQIRTLKNFFPNHVPLLERALARIGATA